GGAQPPPPRPRPAHRRAGGVGPRSPQGSRRDPGADLRAGALHARRRNAVAARPRRRPPRAGIPRRRDRGIITLCGRLSCAALLLGLFVAASAGQDAPPIQGAAERKKALLEGTHVFRRLLHDRGFTPLTSFGDLRDDPKQSVVIIFGDLDLIEGIP